MLNRFVDVVRGVVAPVVPAGDLESALMLIGPEAQLQLGELDSPARASLADQFIRNLRSQGVGEATQLQRQLLLELGVRPVEKWSSNLDTAVALVELRNHLKQSLTLLGLDWNTLTRAQSLVGGVARWLRSIGRATVEVMSSTHSVDFVLTANDCPLTPQLVRDSPMVQMLGSELRRVDVSKQNVAVAISFSIQRL